MTSTPLFFAKNFLNFILIIKSFPNPNYLSHEIHTNHKQNQHAKQILPNRSLRGQIHVSCLRVNLKSQANFYFLKKIFVIFAFSQFFFNFFFFTCNDQTAKGGKNT